MITKFSIFESSIRDEFPGMFEPRTAWDIPESVPGFEDGTIDPEDDDIHNGKSDKERFQEFLKVVKERNIKENENEIFINLTNLWQDFNITIFDARKYFREFLSKELIGKYITHGFKNIEEQEEHYQGTIKEIVILFDGENAYIDLALKEIDCSDLNFCEDVITIDKTKTAANKYNL